MFICKIQSYKTYDDKQIIQQSYCDIMDFIMQKS